MIPLSWPESFRPCFVTCTRYFLRLFVTLREQMCRLKRHLFFSRTGFRNNFRKKRAICAQPFFNTLFSARKVGEAMMLGSRKNLIGKCSWGKKKGEFLIFLCFVVRIDQRAWYHWKPRSFVENMF